MRRALAYMAFSLAVLAVGCGTSGSASGDGGQSGTCDAAAYPCGPYGSDVGSVIANLSLTGQRDDDGNGAVTDDPVRPIQLADYHADPGVKVLVIATAAEWCAPCMQEQPELVALWKQYHDAGAGVAFLEAVIQKLDTTPADTTTVDEWATRFHIPFDMASDPTLALSPYYDINLFPSTMVVRTSDMVIVAQNRGYQQGWLENAVDAVLP